MQYKIVSADGQYDLSSKVEDLIKQGWLPQGGVSFKNSGYKETWAQAMVKVNV